MGKQTVSISFEGADMKEIVNQMIEFLQSVGVFKSGGEHRGKQTEDS